MLSTYLLVASCLLLYSEAALNPMKKLNKIQPTLTNSIINLGKMDVAFYLHSGNKDQFVPLPLSRQAAVNQELFPISSSFIHSSAPEVPCPCSSIQSMNKGGYVDSPPSILNKLLMNNELFSFREPTTSMDCCDSQEIVEEKSFVFDFGNSNPFSFPRPIPQLPFLKPKQLEIFLMPQKSPLAPSAPKRDFVFLSDNSTPQKEDPIVKKDQISVVGDKQTKLDFEVLTKDEIKNKQIHISPGWDNQMSNDVKLDLEALTNNEKPNSNNKVDTAQVVTSP